MGFLKNSRGVKNLPLRNWSKNTTKQNIPAVLSMSSYTATEIQAGEQSSLDTFAVHCSNDPCSPSRDIMCGKLYCSGGQEMPTYGSLVTFESCKASFPRNGDTDLGMILNGTKCGDGMVSRGKKTTPPCFFPLSVLLTSWAKQEGL